MPKGPCEFGVLPVGFAVSVLFTLFLSSLPEEHFEAFFLVACPGDISVTHVILLVTSLCGGPGRATDPKLPRGPVENARLGCGSSQGAPRGMGWQVARWGLVRSPAAHVAPGPGQGCRPVGPGPGWELHWPLQTPCWGAVGGPPWAPL